MLVPPKLKRGRAVLSFCYKQQQQPPALKASTVDIACTRPRTASSERISCILFAVELIVYQKMLEPHGEVEVLISPQFNKITTKRCYF